MSFFILTGAILIGAIIIAHFAANALGFRLFYTPLFLSALLALSINLMVISMKEATSPLSLAKIVLAVLFASALVTVINDYLIKREKEKLKKKRAKKKEQKAQDSLLNSSDDELEKNVEDEIEEEVEEEIIDDAPDEPLDEPLEDEALEEPAPKKEGFFKKLLSKVSLFNFKKQKSKVKEDEIEEIEEIDAATDTINEGKDKWSKPSQEEIEEVSVGDLKVAEPIPESVDEKVDTSDTSDTEAKDDAEDTIETPKEAPKKESFIQKLFKKDEKPREKLDISKFADLDALLDYAYDAKISGHYLDAVEAYEGAIEKYENDPYLPFLFIDLGNVHKAQGEYNAAIDTYEKAINMPNIEKDLSILKSFEENIRYLKALKIVLRKHKAEHKPFGEIGEDILKEVENDLNED